MTENILSPTGYTIPMDKEIEARFIGLAQDDIEQKLKSAGARHIGDYFFREWIFACPEWFKDHRRLRVRTDGTKTWLTQTPISKYLRPRYEPISARPRSDDEGVLDALREGVDAGIAEIGHIPCGLRICSSSAALRLGRSASSTAPSASLAEGRTSLATRAGGIVRWRSKSQSDLGSGQYRGSRDHSIVRRGN